MKPSAVFENLPWLSGQAEVVADCARKAATLEEYSGYATLRDALRNAVQGMQDIQRLSPDVRARIEGGAA